MDTMNVRIPNEVLSRAEKIRARMAGTPVAATAALGKQLNRSAILRAALDRGLSELEASLDEKGAGPT